MTESHPEFGEERDLRYLRRILRLVCVSLPHLSGLAHLIRLQPDRRVATAGAFASGRVVANPDFLAALDDVDAAFVLSHELLHLALDSHERAAGSDSRLFNIAHDCIINDMLSQAFGRPAPAGGVILPDARLTSAEKLVAGFRKGEGENPKDCGFRLTGLKIRGRGIPQTSLGRAMTEAGLIPADPAEPRPADALVEGDVLSDELEREWYPGTIGQSLSKRRIRAAAVKALSLGALREAMEGMEPGTDPGDSEAFVSIVKGTYRAPWEAYLQRWMDATAPGVRSYARPSRRGSDRSDVVLAGRRREGWTLHVVLDTSGSMSGEFERTLGTIASFCEGAGVGQVRIVQCDTAVTRDELVDIESLHTFAISGLGGSNLSPALTHLGRDPFVSAVVVLTDGFVDVPSSALPYEILWALTGSPAREDFDPGYGHVLRIEPDERSNFYGRLA